MTKEAHAHKHLPEERVVAELGSSTIVSKLHSLEPYGDFVGVRRKKPKED